MAKKFETFSWHFVSRIAYQIEILNNDTGPTLNFNGKIGKRTSDFSAPPTLLLLLLLSLFSMQSM